MTDKENYRNLVREIFGDSFNLNIDDKTNNCIGTLKYGNGNFKIFRDNFIALLKRLHDNFHDYEKVILKTLKDLGMETGYKWSGPYSELVALDYFSQYKDVRNNGFKYSFSEIGNLPESLAKDVGQKKFDVDLKFTLRFTNLYVDVKSFIPTHIELADVIFEKLKVRCPNENYLIGLDDLIGVNFDDVKNDLQQELTNGGRTIIQKLAECVNNKRTVYEHKCQNGNQYRFRLSYDGNVLCTTSSKCPYRYARDCKFKILSYYNKLLKQEASIITFVINPWFNDFIDNKMTDFNKIFYRSLCRRIFMELTNNTEDAAIYECSLKDKGIKVCDIASLVSGVIFIEDNSITERGGELYNTYIYLNPNAKNKKLTKDDFGPLICKGREIKDFDDFEYDNY